MLYEDYLKTIIIFKSILKNYPEDTETLKVHFTLIKLKIDNIDLFKSVLMEHLKISDWFPTHIDLFNHIEPVDKKIKYESEQKDPLEIELFNLKRQHTSKLDQFINNKDPNEVEPLRTELFTIEAKIEALEEKKELMLSKFNNLNGGN